MRTFFDSSAFAKRFVEEAGSGEVDRICGRTSALGLSVLCIPEILSALNRRKREKSLTARQYSLAKDRLLDDVHDAEVIQLTPPVIAAAASLLETNDLRAMDALHITCALEWEPDLFVSSDKAQLKAAKRSGLRTKQV